MTDHDKTVSIEEVASVQAQLQQLVTGFWGARAVHAALSLGVFTHLGQETATAATLAQQMQADVHATDMLLSSLVAVGLLEKEGDNFRTSPVARLFLLPTSPYFQGALVESCGGDWVRWQELEEAVKRGKGQAASAATPEMVAAAANLATVLAPLMARKLDLSRVKRVLDVGGPAGQYSIALAKAKPDVSSVLLDREPGLGSARQAVAAAGLNDRITLKSGDCHQEGFGTSELDLVLLANTLHVQSPDRTKALVQKAFQALVSEGQCVVSGFLTRDDRTGPIFPALYGLQTLLAMGTGRTWSGWDVTDMMQSVGFIRLQIIPLEGTSSSLVVGFRP